MSDQKTNCIEGRLDCWCNVLTPTMKIKRNVVEKTYQEKYEGIIIQGCLSESSYLN